MGNVGRPKERHMHWLYFCFIGWWAWTIPVMFVVPLITSGGRRLIAAFAGYW